MKKIVKMRGKHLAAGAAIATGLLVMATRPVPAGAGYLSFATPELAVQALTEAAKRGTTDALLEIFGPDAKDLIVGSDPATTRQNREVFVVAASERWHLEDLGTDRKTLVIGNEGWPFPVPLVKGPDGWHFDTAAGKEEVLARRIGHNELAVIRICYTYVAAQGLYALRGHDGRPAGLYAQKFQSDPGRQNGLYWPAARGEKRSPLGDMVANAAAEGRSVGQGGQSPSPFHGYFFKILTSQGPSVPGGARSYITSGEMSRGFALVAWPAVYDASGVMTFIVNQDGVVRQKDLGPGTDAAAKRMSRYEPDTSWAIVP